VVVLVGCVSVDLGQYKNFEELKAEDSSLRTNVCGTTGSSKGRPAERAGLAFRSIKVMAVVFILKERAEKYRPMVFGEKIEKGKRIKGKEKEKMGSKRVK
jgi:hypothetical protein